MKKLLKRPQIHEAQRQKRWLGLSRPWSLSMIVALSLFVTFFAAADRSFAFCERRYDGSICHVSQVFETYTLLRPEIGLRVVEDVLDPDNVWIYASDDHFDSCNFDGATERINERYDAVVSNLSPDNDGPADVFEGATVWSYILHAAQDFYSHSNWVELIEIGARPSGELIDTGLGPWVQIGSNWFRVRDNVLASQEDVPSGWIRGYSYGDPFIAHVAHDGRTDYVLLSGDTWNAGQECPNNMEIHHDDVHKDNIERGQEHFEAAELAEAQTRHEWCRLLHLMYDRKGIAGASVPMGLMTNLSHPGQSARHPDDTPCAEAVPGPIEVTVSVNNIGVLNDHDDDSPGEMHFAFTLYTTDFKRSVATPAGPTTLNSGDIVPASVLPSPLTVCMLAGETLVATVQGWDDDYDILRLNEDDDILVGASHLAGSGYDFLNNKGIGTYFVSSDSTNVEDILVEYEISNTPTDTDGDGVSYCTEIIIGTDPNNPDTDGDGLSDNEGPLYGTDPLKADSDGDGLLDGSDVDFIRGTLSGQPLEVFTSPADYQNLHDLLDVIEATLLGGDLETAVNQVLEMRQKVNGCGIEPDGDDVIIYCEPQREIRSLLDLLMRNLGLDLDFDWLPDYFEMVTGSDYMYPDTDGDGLLDGLDIEFVRYIFDAQPMQVYMSQGDYEDIQDRLILIEESLYLEQAEVALTQLQSMLERMNGCGDTPDADDAFADCTVQMEVRNYIEMLMSNLQKQSDSTNISKKSVGPF